MTGFANPPIRSLRDFQLFAREEVWGGLAFAVIQEKKIINDYHYYNNLLFPFFG
ncbi:MAG: hypothetical protein MJA29_12250 [Candidatus Omnitrophica bacterium]|nr:hypothetical protein [Candidatus Omnitrophota bacterium]